MSGFAATGFRSFRRTQFTVGPSGAFTLRTPRASGTFNRAARPESFLGPQTRFASNILGRARILPISERIVKTPPGGIFGLFQKIA